MVINGKEEVRGKNYVWKERSGTDGGSGCGREAEEEQQATERKREEGDSGRGKNIQRERGRESRGKEGETETNICSFDPGSHRS